MQIISNGTYLCVDAYDGIYMRMKKNQEKLDFGWLKISYSGWDLVTGAEKFEELERAFKKLGEE